MSSAHTNCGVGNTLPTLCFAAGVLISVSFVHIISKSFRMTDTAPVFLLIGFLAIYLSSCLLNLYLCHDYERAD